MSKNERPLRRELAGERLGQRLAGDDVAPDRDDPAAERRRHAVRVAVGRHEHVAGEDRPALGLDDEPAVGLAPDRRAPAPLVEVGAGPIGGRRRGPRSSVPGGAGRSRGRPARRSRRPSRSRSRIRSRGTTVGLDAHDGEALPGVLELLDVRRRVGQLQVAGLAEVAVDRLVGDQPLDGLVAVERLAIERPAGLLAVARDQLARAPLVAGVDDPAVAGRAPRSRASRPRAA